MKEVTREMPQATYTEIKLDKGKLPEYKIKVILDTAVSSIFGDNLEIKSKSAKKSEEKSKNKFDKLGKINQLELF